jgi:hypothetical protein
MKGFPTPAAVRRWSEGSIPPPEGGNSGNTETPGPNNDTYREKGVSKRGNSQETREHLSGNGHGTPDPKLIQTAASRPNGKGEADFTPNEVDDEWEEF